MTETLNSGSREKEIIEAALQGDQSAYEKLYRLHVDALFAFLNQFSDNREQTAEWTQISFIKAFEKLESFRTESKFKTWLFSIALNVMRSSVRSKRNHIEFNSEVLGSIESEIQDTDTLNEDIWAKAKKMIRNLDPQKRVIVLLHIAEGYQHNEIAEMLGISKSTSRVTLHRAKNELREMVTS